MKLEKVKWWVVYYGAGMTDGTLIGNFVQQVLLSTRDDKPVNVQIVCANEVWLDCGTKLAFGFGTMPGQRKLTSCTILDEDGKCASLLEHVKEMADQDVDMVIFVVGLELATFLPLYIMQNTFPNNRPNPRLLSAVVVGGGVIIDSARGTWNTISLPSHGANDVRVRYFGFRV